MLPSPRSERVAKGLGMRGSVRSPRSLRSTPSPSFLGSGLLCSTLLGDLSASDWEAPTVCPGWSVKDVAAHLLGDDIGRLSWGRDGYVNPAFAAGLDIATLPGLVAAIDRQNAVWVTGARRISPRLLIELLEMTGELTEAYFTSLDMTALGMPVDWAGPEPAPVWLDVAREYTERWVHQQHIRDAVGKPGLKERRWFAPVLDAFVRGLPRVLRDAPVAGRHRAAADHHRRRRRRVGRAAARWRLEAGDAAGHDGDGHGRARTRRSPGGSSRRASTPHEARQAAHIDGDPDLAERVFATVSILG